MAKLIEAAWEKYRAMAVPAGAGETQVKETRQAFYSGVTVLFTMMLHGASPGEEVTDADMQFMASVQVELDAFGAEIDQRFLPRA